MRIKTLFVTTVLAALALAPAGEAKPKDEEAAFKLLSASGTQTHTFHEEQWDSYNYDGEEEGTLRQGSTLAPTCVGTQSQSLRYSTTKPVKMFVFLREAHGLHTLISNKRDPDSGLDFLEAPGEMTLSRSISYEQTKGCQLEPVACPETTFSNFVFVFGTHDPSRGVSPAYDTNLDLPSGFDRSCSPRPGGDSAHAVPRDFEIPYLAAIPRSDIFNEKKKRLSGEDSFEFSYEVPADPSYTSVRRTVAGTYGETMAVELKRLKPKKD